MYVSCNVLALLALLALHGLHTNISTSCDSSHGLRPSFARYESLPHLARLSNRFPTLKI